MYKINLKTSKKSKILRIAVKLIENSTNKKNLLENFDHKKEGRQINMIEFFKNFFLVLVESTSFKKSDYKDKFY